METYNKVFVSRRFNCSKSELFDWLVQPELITRWFGPKQLSIGSVQTDIRIGGKYSIELKKSGDENFFIEGEYVEVNVPDELAFTFQYRGLAASPPKSIVKIKLEELAENKSLLSLTQDFEFTPSDINSRTKSWEHMFQTLEQQIKTVANNI